MNISDEKIKAIENVHREFLEIMQNEQCRTCSCLHTDMMASILDTIRELNGKRDHSSLNAAHKDFSKWIEDAGKKNLHH